MYIRKSSTGLTCVLGLITCFLMASRSGCVAQTAVERLGISPKQTYKVTRSEKDVLAIVCKDVLKWEGIQGTLQNVAKHRRTPQVSEEATRVGKEEDDTVLADIKLGKTKAISKALVRKLEKRNTSPRQLIGFAPPAPYRLVSSAQIEAQLINDQSRRPEFDFSVFTIIFALPVYREREALVFFRFLEGTGGHGGGYGFYHLIRSRNQWRIRTKYIEFIR